LLKNKSIFLLKTPRLTTFLMQPLYTTPHFRFWLLPIISSFLLLNYTVLAMPKNAPYFLAAPTLTAPTDNAQSIAVTGTDLRWTTVAGVTEYVVELADNKNFFAAQTWNTNVLQQNTGNLRQNTTYYWRVRGHQTGTIFPYSSVFTFVTAQLAMAPTPVSPANNATNISISGTLLKWNAIADATYYTVRWADNPSFINASIDTTFRLQYTTAPLSRNTTFYWAVRAENVGGSSPFSNNRAFTTEGLNAAPTPTLPAQNAITQAVTGVTMRWNALTGATSYVVQWADNPDFVNYQFRQQTNIYATTAALNQNTTYYWRVLGRNGAGDSPFSAVFQFTTSGLNAAPSLSYPADAAIGILPSGAYAQWNTLTGASNYVIETADNPNFVNPTAKVTTSPTYSYANPNLTAGKTYYWRVKGQNSGGASPLSAVRTFSTSTIQPALAAPLNLTNSIAQSGTNLTWAAYPDAAYYTVQYTDNVSFTNPIIFTTTSLAQTTNALSANTNYYWRVKATTTTGASAWSATWAFTTTLPITASPNLVSPANNTANIAVAAANVVWQAVANADMYELQLSPNANFTSDITTNTTADLNFSFSNLLANTNYYWRVRGKNGGTTGDWSLSRKFTTITYNTAPTLSLPLNNAQNIAVTTNNFSWQTLPNVTAYEVQLTANGSFNSDIRNYTTANTTITLDTFLQDVTYFWRVRGIAGNNTTPWSAIWVFRTNYLAQSPTLTAPADALQNIALSGTTLAWSAVVGAAHYEVQYAPTPTFFGGVITQNTAQTTANTTALTSLYTYYWRVRAANIGGNSAWSPVWSFTVADAVIPTINSTLSTICAGQATTVTATGGATYVWNNGSTLDHLALTPTATTTYTVTVTKASGATVTLSQTITVNALPIVTYSGGTTFCSNERLILTANGASDYEWSDGTIGAEITIYTGNTYTVTATSAAACTAVSSILITELPLPATPVIAQTQNILSCQTATTYQWFAGATPIATATNQSLTITQSGIYKVCVTGANGCSNCSQSFNAVFVGTTATPTKVITAQPNPVNNGFSLRNLPDAPCEIQIFNTIGALQQTLTANDTEKWIDTSAWAAGVYRIVIVANGEKTMISVVK
jgi:hypothetical protein